MTRQFKLSASSVAAFKACPQRFRLAYREGLRLIEDTESQRVGTNWHSVHEIYRRALNEKGHVPGKVSTINDANRDAAVQAVVNHLNVRYQNIPTSVSKQDWDLERTILFVSFLAYLEYYEADVIEYLANEIPFELPLYGPKTGLPLKETEVLRVGKIDHLIRWRNMVGVLERKSTTRSVDPDSDFWDRSQKDTQVSMYALALRDLDLSEFAISTDTDRIGNTLYDVWRRPQIRPKMLSQKDTAAVLETKSYFGQDFSSDVCWPEPTKPNEGTPSVIINNDSCEVEVGKKGFAIRETVAMFGARLFEDIRSNPTKYFARREIARTDRDLQRFQRDLFNIYQAQKSMDATNGWFENEAQCRATYPCPYIPICYGYGAEAAAQNKDAPSGFKRIFVDLTCNGDQIGD